AGQKTQAITLTVKNPGTPPSFSSEPSTTFTVGTAKTFTIATTSNPTAAINLSGSLPPGLTFTDNGNGTAKISGTATNAAAAPATSQPYPLTLEAVAKSGSVPQSFTLTVVNPGTAPSFESAATTGFTTGKAGSFKVQTTAAPTAALTISSGTLPGWLSFTDNGDGTATFAGTPPASAAPAGSSKNYAFTLKAKNAVSEIAQSFTLTVTNPGGMPVFEGATSTSFTTGVVGSFKVTSTGEPTASLTVSGTLPPGLSFTDNGDGTATIAGTPTNAAAPPASSQNWPVTVSAVNAVGKATRQLTLTVVNPGAKPQITSADSTGFTTGAAGSFELVSTGAPDATFSIVGGALPTNVKLTNTGNGRATIAGTPPTSAAPPASSKPYAVTLKATNGAGSVTQSFTLTVTNPGVKPTFSGVTTATFTTGKAASFTISAEGSPTPALSRIEGELPDGLTFTDNGDGTATIAGTAAASAAPSADSQPYPVTIKATNGAGSATRALTLTVVNPGVKPEFSTGTATSFTTGTAGSFKVNTSADPTAALSVSGTLPAGVGFTDNGNGSATIAGTPAASAAPAGSSKPYPITIKATNGAGSREQSFVLTVVNPGTGPSIKSAASAEFEVTVAGSFEVSAEGSPKPALSVIGTLPAGVSFSDEGEGKAKISGTPAVEAAKPGESKEYPLTIKATSGVGNVSQQFTLTVTNPGVKPSITSDPTAPFTTGAAGSFTVTTAGDPTPALTRTGSLPAGLTFTANGDGTATIAGIPAESAAEPGTTQTYTLTLKAKSKAGEEVKALNVTVKNPGTPPSFKSGQSISFTTGVEKAFTVSTEGNPVAALAKSGALPPGLTFTDNGNGTAKIFGTPAAAAAAPGTSQDYQLTLEASSLAGSATQPFTLTVVNPEQPPVEDPPVQGGGQPQPQPPVVTPPTTQPPVTEAPLRVSLSQAKVELLVGRASRKVVGVTVSAPALVTCKGKLPKGARCRVNSQGNVVIETTKALKRTGTFKLTIKAAGDGGDLSRRLTVRIG
ncbi:MAG TPA: hypothetical protein VMS11_10500, partial [Solirubrobacterales bacterium]|nr:hypothetical protein [Solirubrobacterales bacterium]